MKCEDFINKFTEYELSKDIPFFLTKFADNEVVTNTFIKLITNFIKHLKTVKVTPGIIEEAKVTRERIQETITNIKLREDFHLYNNLIEFLEDSKYEIDVWLLSTTKNAQFYVKEGLTGIAIDPAVKNVIASHIIRGKDNGILSVMDVRGEKLSSVLDYTLRKLHKESQELKRKNDEKAEALRKYLKQKGYSKHTQELSEEPRINSALDLITKTDFLVKNLRMKEE